jgi:hypothetical protein
VKTCDICGEPVTFASYIDGMTVCSDCVEIAQDIKACSVEFQEA